MALHDGDEEKSAAPILSWDFQTSSNGLRHYKSASSSSSSDDDDNERRRIFSYVSLLDPSIGAPRFTLKWAAMLICLFSGISGELHIIPNKRASTHSVEVAFPGGRGTKVMRMISPRRCGRAREEIVLELELVKYQRR